MVRSVTRSRHTGRTRDNREVSIVEKDMEGLLEEEGSDEDPEYTPEATEATAEEATSTDEEASSSDDSSSIPDEPAEEMPRRVYNAPEGSIEHPPGYAKLLADAEEGLVYVQDRAMEAKERNVGIRARSRDMRRRLSRLRGRNDATEKRVERLSRRYREALRDASASSPELMKVDWDAVPLDVVLSILDGPR